VFDNRATTLTQLMNITREDVQQWIICLCFSFLFCSSGSVIVYCFMFVLYLSFVSLFGSAADHVKLFISTE
jgi:hypothetical protein